LYFWPASSSACHFSASASVGSMLSSESWKAASMSARRCVSAASASAPIPLTG
jgi:hypothetical protein